MTFQHKQLPWHERAQVKDALRTFAFFSANLRKLLPALSLKEHMRYFKETLSHQALATNQQRNEQWLAESPAPFDFLASLRQPGIIASFHTGPYRLLSMWLMKHRIPFTLVLSADVMVSQEDANRRLHQQIAGKGQEDLFKVLLAEDPFVLRKMMRALQHGHFILLYIDGNVGSGKNSQKGMLTIDFLAHRLQVRTGPASLSSLAKVPVYPVLPYFDDNMEPQLYTVSALVISAGGGRSEYIQQTMKTLYDLLAKFLHERPTQWEGWLYVHHDLVRQTTLDGNSFLDYYMPFSLGQDYFLLHKDSYFAYRISGPLYNKICDKCFQRGCF